MPVVCGGMGQETRLLRCPSIVHSQMVNGNKKGTILMLIDDYLMMIKIDKIRYLKAIVRKINGVS